MHSSERPFHFFILIFFYIYILDCEANDVTEKKYFAFFDNFKYVLKIKGQDRPNRNFLRGMNEKKIIRRLFQQFFIKKLPIVVKKMHSPFPFLILKFVEKAKFSQNTNLCQFFDKLFS